jgi:hypothetical protein
MRFARFVGLFVMLASGMLAAQSNPVPLINQPLVPDAVAPGGQGFMLTVNGTGFVSGSVVNWNGNPRALESVCRGESFESVLRSLVLLGSHDLGSHDSGRAA